jgi:hypothetical protein
MHLAYEKWWTDHGQTLVTYAQAKGQANLARASTVAAEDVQWMQTVTTADVAHSSGVHGTEQTLEQTMSEAVRAYKAALAQADRDYAVRLAEEQRFLEIYGSSYQSSFDAAKTDAEQVRAAVQKQAAQTYAGAQAAAILARVTGDMAAEVTHVTAYEDANVDWTRETGEANTLRATTVATAARHRDIGQAELERGTKGTF